MSFSRRPCSRSPASSASSSSSPSSCSSPSSSSSASSSSTSSPDDSFQARSQCFPSYVLPPNCPQPKRAPAKKRAIKKKTSSPQKQPQSSCSKKKEERSMSTVSSASTSAVLKSRSPCSNLPKKNPQRNRVSNSQPNNPNCNRGKRRRCDGAKDTALRTRTPIAGEGSPRKQDSGIKSRNSAEVKHTSPTSIRKQSLKKIENSSQQNDIGNEDKHTFGIKTKRSSSQMKPKFSRNLSTSKERNSSNVNDVERFWAYNEDEHWKLMSSKDYDILRRLQEEQYQAFKCFMSSAKDVEGSCNLQYFEGSKKFPVPAPLSIVQSLYPTCSISHQLALRGSMDEHVWSTVLSENQPLLSGFFTEPRISHPENSSDDRICDTFDAVHMYLDANRKLREDAAEVVDQNESSLAEDSLCFPNPLPLMELQNSIKCAEDGKNVGQSNDLDPDLLEHRLLGKRGRPYGDVWNESDFLRKKAAQIGRINSIPTPPFFRSKVVDNWGKILNNYSDDHDGMYIEWLLNNLRTQQKDMGTENSVSRTLLFSPPVPVSSHHPAAWGLTSKLLDSSLVRNEDCSLPAIRSTEVHPAALSSQVVLPTGSLSSDSNTRQDSDVDDMNVHLDCLVGQLTAQCAKNYALCGQLITAVGNETCLQSLREKHTYLEAICLEAHRQFNKASSQLKNRAARESFEMEIEKSTVTRTRQHKSRAAHQKPEILEKTMCAMYGASQSIKFQSHFASGEFCRGLQVGDKVEVNCKRDVWSLCTVVSRWEDSSKALRFVQTRPVGGCLSDLQWVSVDDNLLSKPGVHLPPFLANIATENSSPDRPQEYTTDEKELS